MKNQSAGKLNNIVFIVTVALAALGVYLLIGANAALPGGTDALPDAAATPEQPAALTFRPVPEETFVALLTQGEGYLAAKTKSDPYRYGLQCGAANTGKAKLVYTVDDEGYVSSVTLTFPRPGEAPAKPKTPVEYQLVREREKFVAAQNLAVQTLLFAAFRANDLNDVLLEPTLLKWYAEALRARDEERTYSDSYRGCAFETYPAALGGERVFICSMQAGG